MDRGEYRCIIDDDDEGEDGGDSFSDDAKLSSAMVTVESPAPKSSSWRLILMHQARLCDIRSVVSGTSFTTSFRQSIITSNIVELNGGNCFIQSIYHNRTNC